VGWTAERPSGWDAFLLRYRNTAGVRAALTSVPLVVRDGDGRLGALLGAVGAAGEDLQGHVQQLDTSGLSELACLVEGDVRVPGDLTSPHAVLRAVPPGEVWPPAAA